ncbi:hypothetical protein QVD99_001868 [Batrachochytrium dendrobatidis]|nr:hypothetical protein O5D80_000512 [Batrachochytrium dendrobatidis]KAK5672051.1 hypothetical protein QVD99_001868 [Batrachochytrium dendrobatidis]
MINFFYLMSIFTIMMVSSISVSSSVPTSDVSQNSIHKRSHVGHIYKRSPGKCIRRRRSPQQQLVQGPPQGPPPQGPPQGFPQRPPQGPPPGFPQGPPPQGPPPQGPPQGFPQGPPQGPPPQGPPPGIPGGIPRGVPRKGGNTGLSAVDQDCLDAHNEKRALVGVPPLGWSRNQQESAQRWSDTMFRTKVYEHSRPGENLNKAWNMAMTCRSSIQVFFDEYTLYSGQPIPKNANSDAAFEAYGHYTQLVWPSTTVVGCGLAGTFEESYLTCHYDPAGNVEGQAAPVYKV